MAGFVPSSGWVVTGQQAGLANVPRERAGGTGLEALARGPELRVRLGTRSGSTSDVRLPCKGPAKSLPTVESLWWWKRPFDGRAQLSTERNRKSSSFGFVAWRCLDPLSRAPTARQASTRGVVVWWASCGCPSKQTYIRAPAPLQHLTFPRRHCAVYCILQHVIWEGGRWISCIIPRKLRFMGWKKADLTQGKYVMHQASLPRPTATPRPGS